MNEELRECPHCGATRGLYTLDEYGGLCDDEDLITQIFCDNCKSAFENESANNGKELIEAWNRRAERACTFSRCFDDEDKLPTCSACGYEADILEVVIKPGGELIYEYGWCVGCGAKVMEVEYVNDNA